MSIRTEKKLAELGQWWEYHTKGTDDKDAICIKLPDDPNKSAELYYKAMDAMFHIYIDLCEDIKVLEGRGTIGKNVQNIITPGNVLGRNTNISEH